MLIGCFSLSVTFSQRLLLTASISSLDPLAFPFLSIRLSFGIHRIRLYLRTFRPTVPLRSERLHLLRMLERKILELGAIRLHVIKLPPTFAPLTH